MPESRGLLPVLRSLAENGSRDRDVELACLLNAWNRLVTRNWLNTLA
ncbi:MAG: hypothetical protein IJR99_04350 [Kiritimatiellae bacterium]|nr:hypothetical protein [Kiritimatiellia bacterium]